MGFFGGERRRWKALELKKERDKRAGPDPAVWALLRAVVILMFGALVLQLINLQVIKGDEYRDRAEINALREVPHFRRAADLRPQWQPLVQNSARFTAAIVPGDLPERGEVGVYRMIEPVLQMSIEDIEKKVAEGVDRQGAYSPAVIKQDIDRDAALVLMELEPHAPGLRVLVEPTRTHDRCPPLARARLRGTDLGRGVGGAGGRGYLYQDYVGKTG
jgi:cell division protein FtsI/penicillin-binding protein 2